MKTVNLEEILIKACAERRWHLGTDFKSDILKAMREACNQTVDLCAENAIAKMDFIYPGVDEESIIKTKQQVI